jgi:hypothetical protein
MRVTTAAMGALALAAGIAALLPGTGAFGTDVAARPLLDPALSRYAEEHGWFWPAAGIAGEAVAMAGMIWFTMQARTSLRRWRPALDGPTRNLAGVAGGELLRVTRLVPGVRDARVQFTGSRSRPRLVMDVTCDPEGNPAGIRAELAGGPIERYRAAMAMRDLVVVIRFRIAGAKEAAAGASRAGASRAGAPGAGVPVDGVSGSRGR